MENEINLTYQLSENELMDVIRAQSMRTWSFRFLAGFIVILYAYIAVQQIVYGATLELMFFTLAPVILVTVILVLFTLSNPLVRRRIRKEPKYTCEQVWQFSEERIHWQTPYAEANRVWETYPRVEEDSKYFIFFLKSNAFTPIPKRAFASADEIIRFRELLKRKMVS